jgi:biofilm PGA synthesis N-glycosyltransferase PgaC
MYTVVFLPGILLAFFGIYWIAGPMTLIVLPLAMLFNYVMYVVQVQMFHSQGLKVRRNFLGFLVYAFLYGAILQPACLVGYWMELLRVQKSWGTK